MSMKSFHLPAALLMAASLMAADKVSNVERARKELDGATYTHFAKEIKERYPKHVAAFAIVEARVARVGGEVYCPKRSALCGPNPSCKHEKVSVPALDLNVERVLFSTAPYKWPGEFTRYPAYRQGTFKDGDQLQISLYGYATGSTGISLIRRLGAASGLKTGAGS